MSSFAALASKPAAEKKSGGSGNAASPSGADRRLGDSANRKARERFATVVSDWTIAQVGCRVYVRGDFVVPCFRRNRRRRMRTTRKTFKKKKGAHYQLEMMRMLREVNVDNNTVGWYQSTIMGSYFTEELIETFIDYAESIERCVCIIYDPTVNDSDGQFGLKAIKLDGCVLKTHKEVNGKFETSKIKDRGLKWSDVIEEVPIVVVSNSVLVSAMMKQLDANADGKIERANKLTWRI